MQEKDGLMPNLFIVGVQKSGTTTIHDILSRVPGVFMTNPKEPGFFMTYENDALFVTSDVIIKQRERPYSEKKDYLKLFEGSDACRWRGDATTGYFQSNHARELIKAWAPDAHILICLREPVSRAYSAFNWARKAGVEPCESFEEALSLEERRQSEGYWFWYDYTGTSRYSENLKKWLNDFPNVEVILFEDLCSEPDRIVGGVLEWLGLEREQLVPRQAAAKNPSGMPRSALARAARSILLPSPGKFGRLRTLARKAARIGPIQRMRGRMLDAIDRDLLPPEPLSPELRARLKSRFAEEISELESLLGRDLTAWR